MNMLKKQSFRKPNTFTKNKCSLKIFPLGKNKKAQMELLGLAIIVILIILALLFVVRFVIFKPVEEIRPGYVNTEMAANTLSTLLHTNTGDDCRGTSITELLQDAARHDPNIKCDGIDSKDFVKEKIQNLLSQTLSSWQKRYYFTASVNRDNVIDPIGTQCLGEKEQKNSYIPTDAGIMTITLDICI